MVKIWFSQVPGGGDKQIGIYNYARTNDYQLVFYVTQSILLDTVTIYPYSIGEFSIQVYLIDADGQEILRTDTQNFINNTTYDETAVPLGFEIPGPDEGEDRAYYWLG